MRSDASETIHATCVAVDGAGVLLLGASGSGKSDVALRLLASGRSGSETVLVSDDRVVLAAVDGRLLASPPDAIAGRLEVRGVGIIAVPYVREVELVLAVELVGAEAVPRIPDRDGSRLSLQGVSLQRFRLAPFEASTPAKIRMAVHAVRDAAFAEHIDATASPA